MLVGDDVVRPREERPRVVYAPRRRRSAAPFRHHYDVHGLVSIGSDVRLHELAPFRVTAPPRELDIELRRELVGRLRPRRTLGLSRRLGLVVYEEHLGSLGANFSIDAGSRIHVRVSPLLAGSPHVVYTNVIEALLRFVLASKGYILLHSATLRLGTIGVMLSAQTDTGKTTTILRLLREHGATFLSDDMTIVDRDGLGRTYPKPLTISAHTLRAVDSRALPLHRRVALAGQSRVHSKSGRSVGQAMGNLNLPIMGINALTQIVVPPPKYMVTSLVDCQQTDSIEVERLFLIERGREQTEDMAVGDAVDILLDNTEDAYGFPPYRYFAPAIVIGDRDYAMLRAEERSILESAMRGVRIQRMARDDFSWADSIARTIAGASAG
jgi:hypothetical protein